MRLHRRASLVAAALAFAITSSSRADEPAPGSAPARAVALRPEQAADAVLAALAAPDEAALRALAEANEPDPWLVADELLRRGEPAAATHFARAAPRVDVEALPAYVAAYAVRDGDSARRARLAAAEPALAAKQSLQALELLGEPQAGEIDDVVGVRLAGARAVALAGLRRAEEAAATFLAAGQAAEALGWWARAAMNYHMAGSGAFGVSFLLGRTAFERGLAVSERRGDRGGVAHMLHNLGVTCRELGDYDAALAYLERAYEARSALGQVGAAGRSLAITATILRNRGEFERALALLERSLKAQEAAGDRLAAARVHVDLGNVQSDVGEYDQAQRSYEAALAVQEELGDRAGAASTLTNLGVCADARGDYDAALAYYERAMAVREALGDLDGVARLLGNMGACHFDRGAYARALALSERAHAAFAALKSPLGEAAALGNLGSLHGALGDTVASVRQLEQALAIYESLGAAEAAAGMLVNLGNVHHAVGDLDAALAAYEQALAKSEALGALPGVSTALNNIANLQRDRGEPRQALATFQRVLALKEQLGDRIGVAMALAGIGQAHHDLGAPSESLGWFFRAAAESEAIGDEAGVVRALTLTASAQASLGDWPAVLEAARRGARALPRLLGGLADEQGARAREGHQTLFDLGILAGAALGDVPATAEFLERARAGSLLEALGARRAIQEAVIPPALLALELRARAAEARAVRALECAAQVLDREARRTRARELEAARAAVAQVVERIQREAKAGASIAHFEPDGLDAMRARLGPRDALVVYGVLDDLALALVVTREAAWQREIGAPSELEAACEDLASELKQPGEDGRLRDAVAALQRLALAPLELPEGVQRLLVSPDGPLAYVPFGLLAPTREIAFVPSGSTLGVLLADDATRGEGVLALGDPDYQTHVDGHATAVYRRLGPRGLAPLPATAAEARAIGSRVLLRGEATERGLREALGTRARWRSVHLACHGLINADRPGFSSLALTADAQDDGFLTVLEVFRSTIPAELVVLSACETAKGKAVRGEGIMGLTRAFMFAGAPRVLCSLWKVDDEATAALMKKSYECWLGGTPSEPGAAPGESQDPERAQRVEGSRGLPVAEALRQAQAHVRSQARWAHPYYWAAWVLWGLP